MPDNPANTSRRRQLPRAAGSRRSAVAALGVAMALSASAAQASFLSGDALDTAAGVIAWVVLAVVPIVGITVFWIVHVMPEKIAHHRHHPQRQAIQTLCLLSLVFGGLLWPIAWLWAYTRPIGYKAAYGTDKHEDYYADRLEKARRGELSEYDFAALEAELNAMEARAALPENLRRLRGNLSKRSAATAAAPAVSPAEGRSA